MSYEKKEWKDRIAEYPTRRQLEKSDGSSELVTVSRAEGNISQEGDAFSAANMNNLEERIAKEFGSVNSRIDANTFGSQVTLTKNVEYICPADGYLRITCGYEKASVARGYVNGSELLTLSSTNSDSATLDNTTSASVFVRAGMTVKYAGTNAKGYYRPISAESAALSSDTPTQVY